MKFFSFMFFVLIICCITTQHIQAQDTIHVVAGWNLIGAKSTTPISALTSEPSGIVTSSYFGYIPEVGYSQPDTLTAGSGFWVKVSQPGIIITPSVSTNTCPRTITYGNKTYFTALIGQQCWLQQNLNIGTMIPGNQAQADNSLIEKYCFNDLPVNCSMYGGLYTWDEAMIYTRTEGTQGICPTGWHIPALYELEILTALITDGRDLKAVGGGEAFNTSGFSAILTGARYTVGFNDLNSRGNIWASTDGSAGTKGYFLYLITSDGIIHYDSETKYTAFSIRCLKD